MNSKETQPYIYPYPFSSKPCSHPGFHINWAEFHVLYNRSLLDNHFKYSNVYMPIPNYLTILLPHLPPLPSATIKIRIFIYIYLLFIWLCRVFIKALGIFTCSIWTLSCGMWDPVPWSGIESSSPALGVWSLSHWITREVPVQAL